MLENLRTGRFLQLHRAGGAAARRCSTAGCTVPRAGAGGRGRAGRAPACAGCWRCSPSSAELGTAGRRPRTSRRRRRRAGAGSCGRASSRSPRAPGIVAWLYRAGGGTLFSRAGARADRGDDRRWGRSRSPPSWRAAACGRSTSTGALALGSLAFLGGRLAVVALHELGHALTLTSFGRRPRRIGVKLVLVFPYAFVDTSEAWYEPRRRRIAVSAAGPITDVLLAGVFALRRRSRPPASRATSRSSSRSAPTWARC